MTTLTTMVEALIQQASGHHPLLAAGTSGGQVLGLGTKHDQILHTDPAQVDRTVVNQLIDSALGGLAGSDMHEHAFSQPERQAAFMLKLIPLVLHWIRQEGGLVGALQHLRQRGLETQVASWVGSGVNERITPDMLNDVFERSSIDALAQQFGISVATVETGLAVVLPQLIAILSNAGHEDMGYSDSETQTTIEVNSILTRLNYL